MMAGQLRARTFRTDLRRLILLGLILRGLVLLGLAFCPGFLRSGDAFGEPLPALVDHRFLSPDTLPDGSARPIRDGDIIELWTRWVVADSAGSADSALAEGLAVTADFSALDPGVPGNGAVPARHEPGGIYVILDTLSNPIARADTSWIQIPLTAAGTTGTTVAPQIGVCLSNHPPAHVGTEILNPKPAPYRTGDSLVIQTRWSTPFTSPLRLFADVSQVVRPTAPRPTVQHVGGDLYEIHWRLPGTTDQMLADGIGKTVRISARDAGCGSAAFAFAGIDIDTSPPDSTTLALAALPPETHRSTLGVHGEAPGAARVRLFVNDTETATADADPATGDFATSIPVGPGENRVQGRAEDAAGNASPLFPRPAARVRSVPPRYLPALAEVRFDAPDTLAGGSPRPLRAGDAISLWTRWVVPDSVELAEQLEVIADFRAVDQGAPGAEAVWARAESGGVYRIDYALSSLRNSPDTSGLVIPITATSLGGTIVDRSVLVCLSNQPPELTAAHIVDPKGAPYRTGDSLIIETIWRTPFQGPLRVSPDLSQLVQDTSSVSPRSLRLGEHVYRILWRFPFDSSQLMPDGMGKHIPIIAQDPGCGRTVVDLLTVDVDTQPPDAGGLSLDPLPAVTTEDSVTVSGRAPNSAVVLIYRDLSVREVIEPDSLDATFRSRIALAVGENRIQIKAEDLSGNPTPLFPTSAQLVTRVAGATLSVRSPYSREDRSGVLTDDIRILDPSGLESARVRIFNLEGDCLWQAEGPSGKSLEFGVHWTGLDQEGNRAPQGYYLVRGEWRDGNGRSRVLHHGLLLRD